MNYKFCLFADFFQVYLMDVEADDDISEIWTEGALESKLGVLPYTIAVGTFRNVDVVVEVEVCEKRPEVNLEEWDHASIGHVLCKSGYFAVLGCSDYLPDASKIEVPRGKHAVLSLAKGLSSITDEWEDADDLYKIILWPSPNEEHKSVKSYENT